MRARATGLQVALIVLLGVLDSARRELEPREYATVLDVLACRLAADFVERALGDDGSKEQAA